MTVGATVMSGNWTILRTSRTPAGNWIAECGHCPWVGIFIAHAEGHYRVQLHVLAHHGYGMDDALVWFSFHHHRHGSSAFVPTNRVLGQRRIEALLSEPA